jgi:alkaline phosphatase D
MVAGTQTNRVCFWLQTGVSAKAKIRYWLITDTLKSATQEIITTDSSFYIAAINSGELLAGKKYSYEVLLNGQPVPQAFPLQFKAPPATGHSDTITLAMGSCAFIEDGFQDSPSPRYGGDYHIFQSIASNKPDIMLWLGDNIYLRGNDWNSSYDIYERYKQARTLPQMQPLLSTSVQFAIWDDHDYGSNDATSSFPKKQLTTKAFVHHWPGPNYPKEGSYYTVKWADTQLFMLDDRTFRTAKVLNLSRRAILGKSQLEWLEKELITSTATFKLICIGGQVLNPAKVWENFSRYPVELKKLLNIISSNEIKGILFLDGDRHHTVLTRKGRPNRYPLYDLTVSPLTSGAHRNDKEKNTEIVEGTLVAARNYGIIQVTGAPGNRKLAITIKDPNGKTLWSRTIQASELN